MRSSSYILGLFIKSLFKVDPFLPLKFTLLHLFVLNKIYILFNLIFLI
jgi:hypothetical protein